MVEGLRSSRPLVRFRRILPLFAVLFVALSTWRFYTSTPRAVRTPAGDVLSLTGTRPRPAVVATALNLPAFLLALPLELIVFRGELGNHPYYEDFRTIEFTVLGVIFWFCAGRAIDDWIVWRQLRSGSRWRMSDCLISAITALEATMLTVLFAVGFKWARTEIWYLASSVLWALLGYSALLFRIAQLRAYPRVTDRAHDF